MLTKVAAFGFPDDSGEWGRIACADRVADVSPFPTFGKGLLMKQAEKFFACPFCGEPISQVLDLSLNGQICTEFCEICNHRFAVRYSVRNGEVAEFWAQPSYTTMVG